MAPAAVGTLAAAAELAAAAAMAPAKTVDRWIGCMQLQPHVSVKDKLETSNVDLDLNRL